MVMASMAAAQEPLPVVVKVKVTLPEAISAGVGVYTALVVVLFGL
jgi:hypothetical protein